MPYLRNSALAWSLTVWALSGCTAGPLQSSQLPGIGQLSGRGPANSSSAGDLLYLGGGSQESYVLTYPKIESVGTISNGAFGVCSDSAGNVFLTTSNVVQEFAHGATTPFAVLKVPGDFAIDCSVDPLSGDLAVAVVCGSCNTALAVYHHASGTPKTYTASLLAQNCGYDNRGNVFVSGDSSGTEFYELRKGRKELVPISFDPSIAVRGHIQWDGSYLTIENAGYNESPRIYQVQISGSTGTVVGTTHLLGAFSAGNSWILGNRVIAPFWTNEYGATKVGFWKYPQGGQPVRVKRDRRYGFSGANSVTVSIGR